MLRYPLGGSQALHEPAVETAFVPEVDVLDAGLLSQLGGLKSPGEPPGFSLGPLPVDHQADPLLEREAVVLLAVDLLADQIGNDVCWFVTEFHPERVREAVRRVGRCDERLEALIGQPEGGGSRNGGLANAALAGDEEDSHSVAASACRLSPRRATPTIWRSACRRTNPGSVKPSSTRSA